MSYRTIKRLLGETSLERKCRFLLGGGFLVLILIGFFFANRQTESLVWNQNVRTGRLLVDNILREKHLRGFASELERASGEKPSKTLQALAEFIREDAPAADAAATSSHFNSRFLRPPAHLPTSVQLAEYRPSSDYNAALFKKLLDDNLLELKDINEKPGDFTYLKSVRVEKRCLDCHPTAMEKSRLNIQGYKEGELMGAVNIRFPLEETELILTVNRAILLSFAIGTAILAMLFAYIIVRYVIVKPVTHLKEVSEEIAQGNLAIRSDINTGDEFQELSQAFNRMLRSLVSMQDALKKVNSDLDLRLDDLANANLALFEMNRLKSDFLATISHELRTPLNSILGFGEMLEHEDSIPDKKKRWVQNILSSGRVLLGLINDILDLAKLEAGKMQVAVEEFSLRDLVESQAAMVRPLADQKNIQLTTDVEPTMPILKQDGKKLAQIVNNLLSNAIKFTPEGGTVSIVCRQDRAHFLLAVRDNGIGIAPEDQKLVFEKFRQTGSTLTRQHGGTGLGLSIVRELTKLLGGDDVHLESQLGRGSVFTIRLPIQISENPSDELSLGRSGINLTGDPRRGETRYFSSAGAQG
jgi:two-component system, NarL family, sensor histidine kinase BarA